MALLVFTGAGTGAGGARWPVGKIDVAISCSWHSAQEASLQYYLDCYMIEILDQGRDAWKHWRQENPMQSAGLAAANLAGRSLDSYDLSGLDLSRACLAGASLVRANLYGANLSAADLGGANLDSAVLNQATLDRANLISATLTHARLLGTSLKHASLALANLDGADLQGATLSDSHLEGASMVSASCVKANLERAVLSDTNMTGTDLTGARLLGATLSRANLSSAILFDAQGYVFDLTRVNGIQMPAHSHDPWSNLRRHYTGSNFFMHLVLLMIFIVPLVFRTMMWLAVNDAQQHITSLDAQLSALRHLDPVSAAGSKQVLDAIDAASAELNATQSSLRKSNQSLSLIGEGNIAQAIRSANARLNELQATLHRYRMTVVRADEMVLGHIPTLTPCLSDNCKQYTILALLVGWDAGWLVWLPAVTLIAYNICRAVLTKFVGPMHDEELISRCTPALSSYRWLLMPHKVVSTVMYVALVLAGWHFAHWLTAAVWVGIKPS
jgi:uncharacterized protein YjbI with pentapeptide repeats